jgi:hypothetical protein
MLENLLIDIQNMQVRRDSFDTIWFIYLGIDVLETLIKWFKITIVLRGYSGFALSNILLPMEQCPRERFALDSSTGNDFRWYR